MGKGIVVDLGIDGGGEDFLTAGEEDVVGFCCCCCRIIGGGIVIAIIDTLIGLMLWVLPTHHHSPFPTPCTLIGKGWDWVEVPINLGWGPIWGYGEEWW